MRDREFPEQFTGTKIPWSGSEGRSAPAHGTLRVWKRKNQISRAQSRAKSRAPGAIERAAAGEIETAGFTGRVQARVPGAKRDSWAWLPAGAGAAGAGWESGAGLDWQHDILPPHWQHARAGFAHGIGFGADSNGVPASRKLQMMVSTIFMSLLSHRRQMPPSFTWHSPVNSWRLWPRRRG